VQPLCEDKGTTSEPEWRVNGQFGWQSDADWSLTMTARYLDSTEDLIAGRANASCEPQGRVRKVDSYFELGLRGTYNFGENLQLAAGIINLTGEEPSFSETASGGWPWFDQELYDPRGARYYLNLTYNFY
jgi:iron complex outermembrane receptor protein